MVITRLDGTICADVSSKRFELETLLPKIALDASNLTGGRIKRVKYNHVDLTILLHAVPFIDVQSDKTTGYIIGGQVLNDNIPILEAIRTQTDSNAVIVFKDGRLICATEPISSPIVKAFLEIRKQRPSNDGVVDIDSGKKLLGKKLVFSFRPLEEDELEVGLLTSALSVFELRQTFWRSGIYLWLFVIFIVVLTTLSIRRIIARPLTNLLAYSDKVLAGNADARHQIGKISEFNTLGRIMERMVDKLNKSNERLSLEIAERKQAEDHVKLINVKLDNRVKQRTLELEKVNNALSNKIEEIEHTQQELRKLSKAIDQSANSIVITDLDGTIEFVNPDFTRVTGFSPEEAIGRNIRFVNSGRHPKEYFTQMWQTITNGVTWQGEIINRKKNGEEYWEQATISPIKNSDGKITNFVAIKDDITERKRLEEQLRVAKERAESSTRAKSAFLANMSHEIHTPMNAIVGYIELALESNEISEEIRNYLNIARNSSKSLLTLIHDILDISKMETGQLAVEKHKFYLPRLLHDVLQTLQLTIQEKKIRSFAAYSAGSVSLFDWGFKQIAPGVNEPGGKCRQIYKKGKCKD